MADGEISNNGPFSISNSDAMKTVIKEECHVIDECSHYVGGLCNDYNTNAHLNNTELKLKEEAKSPPETTDSPFHPICILSYEPAKIFVKEEHHIPDEYSDHLEDVCDDHNNYKQLNAAEYKLGYSKSPTEPRNNNTLCADNDSVEGAFRSDGDFSGEEFEENYEEGESDQILGISHSVFETTNPESKEYKCSGRSSKEFLAKHTHESSEDTISSKSGKVNESKTVICSICSHMMFNHTAVLRHMHKHVNKIESGKSQKKEKMEYVMICAQCNETFSLRNSLILHLATKHISSTDLSKLQTENNMFACQQCEYKSSRKYHLSRHIAEEHRDKSSVQNAQNIVYKCKQCDYQSKSSPRYKRHIETRHRKTMRCMCTQCDFKTNSSITLHRHVQTKHGQKTETFMCKQCEFKSHSGDALLRHFAAQHVQAMST